MSGYPKGAVAEAIDALELSYSYLRDKPVIELPIRSALDLLYRARELEEGIAHPYRKGASPIEPTAEEVGRPPTRAEASG